MATKFFSEKLNFAQWKITRSLLKLCHQCKKRRMVFLIMRTDAACWLNAEKSLYISFIWTSRRWGGGLCFSNLPNLKGKIFCYWIKRSCEEGQSIAKAEKEIKSAAAVLFLASVRRGFGIIATEWICSTDCIVSTEARAVLMLIRVSQETAGMMDYSGGEHPFNTCDPGVSEGTLDTEHLK